MQAQGVVMLTPTKQRDCKTCGSTFTPWSTTQTVCSPTCASKFVRTARKTEKAQYKAKLKASRETIPKLIAAAQTEFNAFIRERDKDKGCFVCLRPFEPVVGRVQHAGHVRSRAAAGHLRYDEDNCHGE